MAKVQRVGLEEILGYFDDLEDPRDTVNRKHPLVSVVLIAMMAVLSGAGGPPTIAKWAARGAVEGAALDRDGDVGLPAGRPRDQRRALLHQQLAGGREAFCPGGPQSLVDRERLPLEPGHDLPRGRVAPPRAADAGELCLAQPLQPVASQAASRQG
jgi:hypothetical protein